MNQQTLQKIYKAHQPDQYFSRYFNQAKLRQDSRQFGQFRDIKITIRDNSVAVSRGQTIVICQLSTSIEKVILDKSSGKKFGKSLINVNVELPRTSHQNHRQVAKQSYSIQEFINSKVQWEAIESQIAVPNQIGGNKYFAHTGNINTRVVSADGALNQTVLLAVQLLLHSCRLPGIDPQSGNPKQDQFFMLEIIQFLFPIQYCEILNQLLIDPTLSEQDNCSFTVTVLKDLLSLETQPPNLIQKVKKDCDKIQEEVLKSISQLWKIQMGKLTFDIKALRNKISEKYQQKQESANYQPIDVIISFD